jgi:hypothetical protein
MIFDIFNIKEVENNFFCKNHVIFNLTQILKLLNFIHVFRKGEKGFNNNKI